MPKRAHWFGLAALMLLPPLVAASSSCQATCSVTADCGDGEFCSLANNICATPRSIGFCKPIPASCSAAPSLVCGCDGKQYVNSCVASLAGQSVASTGPCVIACGGSTKLPCPDGQFCQFKDGDCGSSGMPGTCAPITTTCANTPPGPVCGCDSKTHANRCAAQLIGMNVQGTGACSCGGPSGVKCETGKFCDFKLGTCAGANPTGVCAIPPKTCQPFSSPVCGCDGKVYDSACHAAQAEVALFANTSCPCGGPANTPCADTQFCDFGMTGTCLKPNAVGVCQPRPTTCPGVGTQVCGCDGNQYLNACDAAKQGASVASSGVCNFGDAGIADAADGGG